jgi:hypothetical protein
MSIYPCDVVNTDKGVIYVRSSRLGHNLDGGFITVSGLNADGEMCNDVPVSDLNKNLLLANASEMDARELFDWERRLENLRKEATGSADDTKALHRYYVNGKASSFSLVLNDRASADKMFKYLDEALTELDTARSWVTSTRYDCLKAFKDFHAGYLANKTATFTERNLGYDYVTLGENRFQVGGIYRFEFEPEDDYAWGKEAYVKVTGVTHNRAMITLSGDASAPREGYIGRVQRSSKLKVVIGDKVFHIKPYLMKPLPIGSFQDIDAYRKAKQYDASTSLGKSLENIFLDTFSAGEGKPLCLPSHYELEGNDFWSDSYTELVAEMMNRTSDMLFDIEKSIQKVHWVRDQLDRFYDEVEANLSARNADSK